MHMGRWTILASWLLWCAAALAAAPPNIVLILADDLGYGDLGCYGAEKIRTPHIDRLAREGRLFTDAHASSAACTPSRYGLLTGEYAWRKDCYGPVFHEAGLLIATNKMTVPKLLQSRGYACACVGKWHLGFGAPRPDWNGELKPGPLEVGFDYYFGVPVVSSHPPFVYVENRHVLGADAADPLVFGRAGSGIAYAKSYPEKKGVDSVTGGRIAHALYDDDRVCATLTDKAVRWLRENKGRPFFLYFPTTNIHHPFTPQERFVGSSRCGLYGDFVQELDGAVGEILQALDELELSDRTLVLFTSDNGGMLNGAGQEAWASGHRMNGDLLGFKFGAWEGGHRVPFLARWPGHIPAGSRSDQLLLNVDLLATLAALTGYRLRSADGPDSFNLLTALTGTPDHPLRDHGVMAAVSKRHLAFRAGPWVYIGARGSGGFNNGLQEVAFTRQANSDVTADGRLRENSPGNQLYNLESDPSQRTNVVTQHALVARDLRRQLEKIMKDGRSAPRPKPDDERKPQP